MKFTLPWKSVLGLALVVLVARAQAVPIDVNDGQHVVHLQTAPKRVVALEFSFIDALAAVGVTPVGAADDGDPKRVLPRVRNAIGEWASVGLRAQPSIEQIARLKPDLIIADLNRHQALYSDLSQIAPTLLLPSRGEDYEGSLKSGQIIGQAIGKQAEMNARIEANRQHLASVASAMPKGVSVLFGVAREDSFSVHGPSSYAGSVLAAIGLKVPPVRTGAAPTEFISLEQLLALNPDWLLVGHYRRPSIVDGWSQQPLWQVLTSVREHHSVEVDGDTWARNRGIMASEQIADDALSVIKGGKAEMSN